MYAYQKIIDGELKTLTLIKGTEIEYVPKFNWSDFTHSNEYFPDLFNSLPLEEKRIIIADLTYWLKDIIVHYFTCYECGYELNHKLIFEKHLYSYNLLIYISKYIFNDEINSLKSFNKIIEGSDKYFLPEKMILFLSNNPNEAVKIFLYKYFRSSLIYI